MMRLAQCDLVPYPFVHNDDPWTRSCPRGSFDKKKKDVYFRVQRLRPLSSTVRTGLHRHRGYTTQPVERSHVPTRDRLRGARGLRTVLTGQKFSESFETLHALRRGTVKLRALVPGYRPTQASEYEKIRTVLTAMEVLGTQLQKAA